MTIKEPEMTNARSKYKQPKKLSIDAKEFDLILELVKPHLTEERYEIVDCTFQTVEWLSEIIKGKNCSIAKLRNLMFGKRTESLKNLKKLKEVAKALKEESTNKEEKTVAPDNILNPKNDETETLSDFPLAADMTEEEESSPNETANTENNETGVSSNVSSIEDSTDKSKEAASPNENPASGGTGQPNPEPAKNPNPLKKKNHGPRPLNDYNVSKITYICSHLNAGDICPECKIGRVYALEPQVILQLKGNRLIQAEAFAAEGLRCNICMKIFREVFPEEVITQPKADFATKAIVSLCKYQLGVPLYRLETWQKIQGVPISDSEMWEWTEEVALVIQPVYQTLMKIASNSRILYVDDTTAKILSLMAQNVLIKEEEEKNPKKKKDKERVGIYTTAIVAKQEKHEIALYITGRKNAGENLDDLLDKRSKDLEKPIQACDASSSNNTERHETILSNCLNHARHNFCELATFWPKECLTIIELINQAFMHDRKTENLTPSERLKYHQQNSAPAITQIKSYITKLIDNKEVEPNSNLGKAIAYLNNHWEELTLFLRNGEAPLSNNLSERTIKKEVLIRKNSYFYKNEWGAMVGDILLSVIQTCGQNNVNPYDYLIALQGNAKEVHKNPEAWLPWNYTQNISCSHVNAYDLPKEVIYKHTPNEPPTIIPVKDPTVSKKKKLREHCKDFFTSIYYKTFKKNQYSHPH